MIETKLFLLCGMGLEHFDRTNKFNSDNVAKNLADFDLLYKFSKLHLTLSDSWHSKAAFH